MAAFQILFCFLLLGFLHASGQTTCAVQPPSTTTFKAVLLENLVNVTRAHFVKNSVGADGFSKVNADQKYELFDLFAARYDNSASTQAFLAGFLDILYSNPTPTTTESHLSKVVELIKIGDVDSARVETRNAIAAGMRSNHMLNATNKDRLTMAEAHALAMLLDTIFNTIRSELSTRNFEVYLSLKVGSTLAFAIDTTGSMSGEINAAKSRVSAIINETAGTTDQPLFFVLSEFNDPRVGPTLATTSPTAILTGLNALRASGGGDEPELALAGIYNALIASTKRSVVFMITDATAKDVNLETRVIAQSVIRKIRIVSLLTKNLPSAAGFPLYNRISSSSGGLVTVTSKSDITGTSQLFRALTEQGQVKLKIALNVTAQNSSFVMDSTITRVTILLTRTSLTGNLNVASITNPAGSVGFKELVNNDGLVLIQLNSTQPGKYFINLVEEISFSLEVSGSSVFGGLPTVFEVENVTGAFVHNNQARAGNEAHIVVDMFGDLRGTQLEDICLMTPDFTLIQAIPVARCGNGLEEYRTIPTFTIPTQPFLILLLGKNNVTGEKFHRVDPCIITPLVANYRIDPIPDQVIDSGSVITVSTKFTNNDLADTFTFDVSDSRQYVQSWTPGSGVTTSIAKNVNRNVRITISVPSTAENDVISKVTVIATAQNGKEFVFTTFNVIVRNVKVVKCPTLIAPSGGSLSCSKFNAEGSICQVVCEPDYVIDGAQQTNCTNGSWTFNNLKCRFVGKKQCKVSGDPHYTTFDGKRYDFQGTCIYQTVKTTFNSTRGRLEPFSILVENELRSKSFRKVSWFRRAFIDIKGTLIVFRKRRKISVDGILVNVPIQIEVDSANIVNINQRGSLVVLTTSFGLTITYDGNARFIITLSGSYANLVTGLCGNINGNENDDLRLASNHSIPANPNKFGNSYKVGGWSAGCQDGDPNDADGNCIEANNYRNLCNVVDGSCFTECRAGIKTPDIVQDCVFDMCVTSGDLQALEEAVADYADSCQENGFKICDWRKITKTPKNCQPNAHYEHEGTACPNSCIFPNRAKRCSRPKISGCVCDSGYVLSGQDCVRLSQCGCTSAGRYYKDGDTFLNTDCTERCTCRNTKLTCKATSCVAGAEKCGISPTTLEKTCMPITTATCRATGDPHYRSFDNKKFDFQGSCTYTMVKTVSMPPTRSFAIRTQHEFRPPNKIGTYVKFVYIEFSTASANLTITLGKFNGESSVSAKVENYFMTTQYIRDYKDSLFTVKVQGKGPVVIFCGVEVKYNGHTAKITLPGVYSNKVTGLCGNFNGNENDDTTTANGTFTTDLNEFGVSFQHGTCGTPKPPPPLVCSVADIAKWNSTKFCGVLTSATSIFAACQAKLDLTTLQDDCVFDMCANNGGLSLLHEILALAVEECTPITGPMCNWRANLNVTIPPCPANSTYQGCTSACPNTCSDPDSEDNCPLPSTEGCQCDFNHIWKNNKCVRESQCGCIAKGVGLVEQGYIKTNSKCTETCTCDGPNKFQCKTISCTADEQCRAVGSSYACVPNEANCFLQGPSYYSTFDGKQYNYDGNCVYVLVRAMEVAGQVPAFSITGDKNVEWGIRVPQTKLFIKVNASAGFKEQMVTIHPDGKKVLLDGLTLLPGSNYMGVTVMIQSSFVMVRFNFGLVIRIGTQGGIIITVPGVLRNNVHGMCGSFDDNANNDFNIMGRELSVNEFGEHMKDKTVTQSCTNGKDMPTVCGRKHYLPFIKSPCACGVLRTSDVFSKCRGMVNVAMYEAACTKAACMHKEFFHWIDRMVAGYTAECAIRSSIALTNVRSATGLDMVCPDNSHYTMNMQPCMPTCGDKTASICKANRHVARFMAQEGCQCNTGFIRSGLKCVPEDKCGCTGTNGLYVEHGDSRTIGKCDRKCQCRNGVWNCAAEQCFSNQYCGLRLGKFGCHFTDECKYNNGGCSHICSVCKGTIECKCPAGFGLDTDKKTCKKGLTGCTSLLDEWKVSYADWKQNFNNDWRQSYNAYLANSALPTPTTSSNSLFYWSKWFDTDDSTGGGDNESLERILNFHPNEVCTSPLAMEKKLVSGSTTAAQCLAGSGNIQLRTESANMGLVCVDSDQMTGVRCPDYSVRFLCMK